MSVDPYMRGRMDDAPSYIPPFELGAPLEGSAVGEVVASRGGRGAGRGDGVALPRVARVRRGRRARTHPSSTRSSPLPRRIWARSGRPGLTAYLAVTEIAPVKRGDVVFISAAAGAVGSIAGQIARKLGASRVIGSAGGPRKAAKLLDDFGFDAAIDYKAGPIAVQLRAAAPDGIDVYVDNVGGDHLEAAIAALRVGGRAALVGAISEYNATAPVPGPGNLYEVAKRELTLRGVLVVSYLDRLPEWIEQGAAWLADGTLHTEETVFEGLERAPEAFLGVLRGVNIGKMLVRLGGWACALWSSTGGLGLRLGEAPEPVPRDSEALVEVSAAALNFGELAFNSSASEPRAVLGWDAAGVVAKPASNGSGPSAGTRVVTFGWRGAWAERRAVDTAELAVVPDSVDLGAASALPVAGVTALQALRRLGPVFGRRVLVTGAAGGVGRFAVQLAARWEPM